MPCPQTLPLLQPAQPRLCWSPPKSPAVSPVSRSPPTALTAPAWVPTEGSRSADASTATARDMRSAWIQQFQLISSPILQQFSEPVGCFRLCKRPSHARSHHFPSPLPGGARTGASLASPQLQHRCHRPPKPTAPPVPCPCPTQGCCWHRAQLLHRGCHPHEVPRTPLSPGRALQHRGGLRYGMFLIPPPASQPTSQIPKPWARPGGLRPSCHLPAQMCWASPCQLSPADVSPEPAGRRGSPGGAKRARGWNTKCSAVLRAVLPAGQSWGTRTRADPQGQHTAAPGSTASSALCLPLLGGGRPGTSLVSCFPSPISAGPLCTICSRASIVPELK